jgi:uncharacterized membrane protein YesL
MRAVITAWRATVSFYNELLFSMVLCLMWWATGGIFAGLAIFVGYALLASGLRSPFWLAPLIAIPAGPANVALANAARQVARDRHVDRGFFWDGFRTHWRRALALYAVAMAIMALLLLNIQFYASQGAGLLQALAILWAYLAVLWCAAMLCLPAVLASLKGPTLTGALRTVALLAFANPLYGLVLVLLALLLTALCIVLVIPLPLAWPFLMALLGEHALMLLVERAGKKGAR